MSVSESGGAVYVGQQSEHYSGRLPLWCKWIGDLFHKKMTVSAEVLRLVLHWMQQFLVAVVMIPSTKRWKGICMYGRRTRHKDIC
jgi:hypothetical protein